MPSHLSLCLRLSLPLHFDLLTICLSTPQVRKLRHRLAVVCRNISVLFKTAQTELKRKSDMISELRSQLEASQARTQSHRQPGRVRAQPTASPPRERLREQDPSHRGLKRNRRESSDGRDGERRERGGERSIDTGSYQGRQITSGQRWRGGGSGFNSRRPEKRSRPNYSREYRGSNPDRRSPVRHGGHSRH